jgi:hypothetical protein
MNKKRKTFDVWTWKKKTIISRHVLHQQWYTCCFALPVRRNQQHRNILTIGLATSLSVKRLPKSCFFIGPNKWKSLVQVTSPGLQPDVQEISTVVLGCSGCMVSGIVMMKLYPSCQLAWTFSTNCNPKIQQNFRVLVWCTIHILNMLMKMG